MDKFKEKHVITIKEASDKYKISISTLRNWIFKKDTNGFNEVIRQWSSRKIFIDTELFDEWISKRVRKKYTRKSESARTTSDHKKNSRRYYDQFAKAMVERDINGRSDDTYE